MFHRYDRNAIARFESHKQAIILPDSEIVGTVLNDCSARSMLRKYFVALFAHAVISKIIKDSDDAVLDIYPEFAGEVALETMLRLRAGGESESPCKNEQNDVDDSDSDAESFTDGSETDSDCVMDISDDESVDSALENNFNDIERNDISATMAGSISLQHVEHGIIENDGSLETVGDKGSS